jgi:hypothetical protein
MRVVPERIYMTWIGTLTDDDLIAVEARLHERFSVLERTRNACTGRSISSSAVRRT